MNSKIFGATIATLRKKNGMTQTALAKKLQVSDKAVSKWETGLGFPEITLLPKIAEVFGVTVDYLITSERRGITLAGNLIVDIVKDVDCYPKIGMLSNISTVTKAVGGCACNVAVDLAKMDGTIPLSVVGCVGDDEYGRYMISQLQRYNIDTGSVRVTEAAPTSFSDVISLPTGERTFFHARGANALFAPEDISLSKLNCSILHIGYILLLDMFDKEDPEFGTVMARFLHRVQETGIKTSVDVVSDSSGAFSEKIIPALKYCDYVIINEIECCSIWELNPRNEDGSLNHDVIRDAMERTMSCGVKEKVVVHCKEAGFCLDCCGEFTVIASLKLDPKQIKGSVGAGDAFCAGCLYSIYQGFSDNQMLEYASAAAACNLFSENAVDGMRSRQEIFQMMQQYPRQSL